MFEVILKIVLLFLSNSKGYRTASVLQELEASFQFCHILLFSRRGYLFFFIDFQKFMKITKEFWVKFDV